jgi:glutamine amidotransferase-like uncharacterized protein
MKTLCAIFLLVVACFTVWAQAPSADDISGMYTFLKDGEFVQINAEEGSRVTGFISRYGESDADKGAFLDHLFTEGSLKGNHIEFNTRVVHGVSYEFSGTVERGAAKSTADEGYRVIRGKLTEYTEDADKKTSARSREVTLKSFAQDAQGDKPQKD